MKIVKANLTHIFFIYVPFALIGIVLTIFFTSEISTVLTGFSILTFITALISSLMPFTKQKPLSIPNSLSHKNTYWFGKLLLLQFALLFLFMSFAQAVSQFIVSNYPQQTMSVLLQQTLVFYQGGLWPWPFILLISCAIAYLGRFKKTPALLRTAVQPVIKKHAEGIIGIGIEIFLNQGLLFSSILTIGILTLQTAHTICQMLELPSLLRLSIPTLIIGILLLIFLAKNKPIQLLTRHLWRQNYSDNKLILIFWVSTILILIILNFVVQLATHYFLANHSIQLLSLANNKPYFIHQWLLLSFIWWLGIMPLLTKVIANLTQERSLREIISAGLLLPLVLTICWRLSKHYLPAHFSSAILHLITSIPGTLISSIIGLLIASYLFRNPQTCHITIRSKACSPIERSTVSSLRLLWQLCTYTLAAYLLTNLTFLTILGSTFAAPIFATLFSAILGAIITATRHLQNNPK